MPTRKRECPVCHLRQVYSVKDEAFVAHFFYGDRTWCAGGQRPTKDQMEARQLAKRGRSKRASSGGLPGLGK